MGAETDIQWCDSTVNPTTGCDGCELFVRGKGGPCYAGNFHEKRLAKSLPALYDPSFTNIRLAPGRMAKAARWSDLTGKPRPDKPWLDGMPRMIFISDMADALSDDIPFGYLYDEIIQVVSSDAGRRHAWLWLTKLPHRMAEFARHVEENTGPYSWPENLWAGTSITSQKTAWRAERILEVRAKVRFLSIEPMWGPVDLHKALYVGEEGGWEWTGARRQMISWVICGGESGHGARPCDLAWIRSIRDQCRAAGVSCFIKQLGSEPRPGPNPSDICVRFIKDPKGGDENEWPQDLRGLREFPTPCMEHVA